MDKPCFYKSLQSITVLAVLLTAVLSIHGCGGGGSSSGSPDTDVVNPQEVYIEKAMDETGGTLMVTDPESKAYGAKVIVLPDALTETRMISISTDTTEFDTPANLHSAGDQINFGPDGINFEKSIYISVPYSDTDNDGLIDGTNFPEYNAQLVYFNEQLSEWEKVEILNRNPADNVIEAQTDHFSTYLVAMDEEANNDPASTLYRSGEYFVGTPEFRIIDPSQDISDEDNQELIPIGCVGQDFSQCASTNSCKKCGTPYVLTISIRETLTAVIDLHTTLNGGIPVTFEESGTSVTFDPTEIFEKIDNSGDANLWAWKCDFIPEHTRLQNFTVCDPGTTDAICSDNNEQFFCAIEVIDAHTVRIDFAINIIDHFTDKGIPLPNSNFGLGDLIAIQFEANYI